MASGSVGASAARAQRQRRKAKEAGAKKGRRMALIRSRAREIAKVEKASKIQPGIAAQFDQVSSESDTKRLRPSAEGVRSAPELTKNKVVSSEGDKSASSHKAEERDSKETRATEKEAAARNRKRTTSKLQKRTSRGQPIMKHQIDNLLQKIQQG